LESLASIFWFDIDAIVDGWVTELRKKPHGDIHRRLSTRKLLANIWPLLRVMASLLAGEKDIPDTELQKELYREASHLGELRQAQGFTMKDLAEDYLVLWHQIFGLLADKALDGHFDGFKAGQRFLLVLGDALKTSAQIFHDIECDELLEQSRVDGLTGLSDRRHFWDRLRQELARAKRYNEPVALLIIDIDDFKAYNDSYGHLSGDKALLDISVILQEQCRSSDTVARYGGEEFVIILPKTGAIEGHATAERLRKTIATHPFGSADGRAESLTISTGCGATEEEHVSPQQLLEVADSALYEAKKSGKNRTVAYTCTATQRIRVQ